MATATDPPSASPFYENYYAGGFNSVRGFRTARWGRAARHQLRVMATVNQIVGPDSKGRYTDPDQDPETFGGNILITGGAELLFPLPFVRTSASCVPCCSGTWVAPSIPTADQDHHQLRRHQDRQPRQFRGVGLTWITALGPAELQPGDADQEAGQRGNPGLPVLPGPDLLICT